jgi:hypothetical protein
VGINFHVLPKAVNSFIQSGEIKGHRRNVSTGKQQTAWKSNGQI